jgi:hypothetical protein
MAGVYRGSHKLQAVGYFKGCPFQTLSARTKSVQNRYEIGMKSVWRSIFQGQVVKKRQKLYQNFTGFDRILILQQ